MNSLFDVINRKSQKKIWDHYYKNLDELQDPEYASYKTYEYFKEKMRLDMPYITFWAFLGEELLNPTKCPECGDVEVSALYAGLPVNLCVNTECHNISGFWSWVTDIWFNGVLFPYTGSWLAALWTWIRQPIEFDE